MSTTTSTARPATLPVNEAGLPTGAPFDRDQYVTWDWWQKPGKPGQWTKPPFRPLDGKHASHARREDWDTQRAALAAMRRRGHAGLGFVLTGDLGMVGLDWDKCRDLVTGELAPWAAEWAARFDTRTEITPSGTGLRLFLFGVLPDHIAAGGTKKDDREVYTQLRYLTLTGHLLPGSTATVEPRQDVLEAFLAEYFPAPAPKQAPPVPPRPVDLDEAELIERACSWDDGGEFADLFAGRDRFGNPSRNDWHLAWRGAFLFGGDPARVERMLRASGLSREKWDERRGPTTLLGYTVAKACREQTQYYDPLRPHRTAPSPGDDTAGEASAHTVPPVGDDPLAAYLAMPHEALAALCAELAAGLVARDRALADERRKVRELERLPGALQRFDRNKDFPKAAKPVAKAATFLYHQLKSAGKVGDDGWAQASLAAIADNCAGSTDAVGDQLTRIDRLDVGIHKKVERVPFRRVDDAGQVTVERRNVLYLKVDNTVVDELVLLSAYTAPVETDAEGGKRATWGGKREPCPSCGATATITTVTCAGCGEVLHQTHHDGTMGDGAAFDPATEGGPDEPSPQAPSVPPTPVVVPPRRHTPAGEVAYSIEEAEDDTWDPFVCNWEGCTARLKVGQILCDHHREKPHVPPPSRLAPLFTSARQDWETPPDFFAEQHAAFGFTLDVCALAATAKVPAYLGPDHPDPARRDGLAAPWSGVCWMNPPYKDVAAWVAKAAEEARSGRATVVALVPNRSDTRWYHDHIRDDGAQRERPGVEVRPVKGRLRFVGGEHSATFPSIVVVFRRQERDAPPVAPPDYTASVAERAAYQRSLTLRGGG